MLSLVAIFICIASASGDLPISSQCQPSSCATRAASCSTNSDCECLALSSSSGGICGTSLLSCSSLTPCASDNVTCTVPCTVCIASTRCNKPMCYPLALAHPQVCPPYNSSATLATTETTTVSVTTRTTASSPGTTSGAINSTTGASTGSITTGSSTSPRTSSTTAYVPLVTQCTAATCASFRSCSTINPSCVCYSVSTGGGICGVSKICSELPSCNNSTLTCNDSQSVCILNSCCVRPICFPLASAGNSVCPTSNSNTTVLATTVPITTSSTLINSNYSSALTINSQTFVRTNGASNFYYEAIQLFVYTAGTYTIVSSSNIDTYGYIYANNFIASNLALNLIAQDDDSAGNSQFRLVVYLQPTVTYILIATTYSGGVIAPFNIIASGPSRVSFNQTNTIATTIATTQQTTAIPATNTSCLVWNQSPLIVAGNGTAGNTTGTLNGPWDFSIDNSFNLYISDGNNNRMIKYSNGSSVGIPLTSGSGNGLSQVLNPSGSVIDTFGNLYVSDMFNNRVMKYYNIQVTSQSPPIVGQIVAGGSYGSAFNQQSTSWGVAVDTLGNLYVSDYGNSRVMKWAPSSTTGILVAGLGNGASGNGTNQLACPLGIYVDQSMALYIADACNSRIQKWPSQASSGITVAGGNGQIGYPTDVTVDTYGTIYALSGGGLYRFYPGSTSGTLVIQSYGSNFGFKFDSIGHVYIADYSSSVIRKYTVNSTNCNARMVPVVVGSSKTTSTEGSNGQAVVEAVMATNKLRSRASTTSH